MWWHAWRSKFDYFVIFFSSLSIYKIKELAFKSTKPLYFFDRLFDLDLARCLVQLYGKNLVVDILDQVHIPDYLCLNFLVSLLSLLNLLLNRPNRIFFVFNLIFVQFYGSLLLFLLFPQILRLQKLLFQLYLEKCLFLFCFAEVTLLQKTSFFHFSFQLLYIMPSIFITESLYIDLVHKHFNAFFLNAYLCPA